MNNEATNNHLNSLTEPLWEKVKGELTLETLSLLSPDQVTLLAYDILRSQLLEGGFIQLIQNGYGPFIFLNPFAKAMRLWGLKDFSKWLYDARELYENTHFQLEMETESDDDFMALYEQFPEWDIFDDEFIEMEPEITALICQVYTKEQK